MEAAGKYNLFKKNPNIWFIILGILALVRDSGKNYRLAQNSLVR